MLRCFVLFNINQCRDRKGWPIIIRVKLQRYYSETNLCWEFSYSESETLESHKRETVIRKHSESTLYCWMGKTIENKLQLPSHKTVHLPCQSFLSLTSPLHSCLPLLFFPIFGLSTSFSVILSFWTFPTPWHLSLLHLMWTWVKGNWAKKRVKLIKE